jgi:uncharacterized SAM-binding protein YcdF (DUF218 family)
MSTRWPAQVKRTDAKTAERVPASASLVAVLRRLLLVLAALFVAWLVAAIVLFGFPPSETGAPAHADAVVMLSGTPQRLAKAEALIRQGVSRTLALSSVASTPKLTAARRLCRAGSYRGARVVCFEAQPFSTRGEAETVARLAARHGWRSLVVVSSTFHLTRAGILFRRCFTGRVSLVGASYPWWEVPREWTSETGKLVVQTLFERSC